MDLRRRFARALAELAPPEGRVLAAVSGGADSTALLFLLVETVGTSRVALAHLDHGLREGSADDARFVAALAARLAVPSCIERRVVRRRRGESPEDAARRVRYAFLADAAASLGCTSIATAHHMDDQAETVLYRAATGTGVAGLRGIHAVRGAAAGPIVLRPLLGVRRAELRAWLSERGETWREDPTNARDSATFRNVRAALRHDAIPALARAVSRDVVPLLARLAANVAAEGDARSDGRSGGDAEVRRIVRAFLVSGTPDESVVRLPAAALTLPAAARRVVLEEALLAIRGRVPSAAEMKRLEGCLADGRAATLRGADVTPVADGIELRTRRESAEPRPSPTTVTATVHPASNAVFLARLRAAPGTAEILDAACVALPVTVSAPRTGERFHALGARAPQRMSHYLQRRGIAAAKRPGVAVVRDATGAPVWIVGHGIAKRAAVTPATRSVLMLLVDPLTIAAAPTAVSARVRRGNHN